MRAERIRDYRPGDEAGYPIHEGLLASADAFSFTIQRRLMLPDHKGFIQVWNAQTAVIGAPTEWLRKLDLEN